MNKVAFQGEMGAYSELAAVKYFRKGLKTVPCPHFEAVFRSVDRRRNDYGMIPVENSLAGSIHENYDHLLKYGISIVGEIKLRIGHNLIGNPEARLKNIKRVYSHPQALAQCKTFLETIGVETVAFSDTAAAVKYIKETQSLDAAALASKQAGADYHMKILRAHCEDNEKNFTRFVVISKKPVRPKGRCKTSIVFALKNMPGVLHKALSVFAIRDIDLYKIESRPIPGSPWKYLFYLDLKGNAYHKTIRRSIDHLQEITTYLKVLGSYGIGREVSP